MNYQDLSKEELIHELEKLKLELDSYQSPQKNVVVDYEPTHQWVNETEERTVKNDGLYRNLIESINDVVYEISIDGTIKYLSPSMSGSLDSGLMTC